MASQSNDVELPATKYYGSLISLVKEGAIWAFCYKCNMLLSGKELSSEKCASCGKIDFKQIRFKSKTSIC